MPVFLFLCLFTSAYLPLLTVAGLPWVPCMASGAEQCGSTPPWECDHLNPLRGGSFLLHMPVRIPEPPQTPCPLRGDCQRPPCLHLTLLYALMTSHLLIPGSQLRWDPFLAAYWDAPTVNTGSCTYSKHGFNTACLARGTFSSLLGTRARKWELC